MQKNANSGFVGMVVARGLPNVPNTQNENILFFFLIGTCHACWWILETCWASIVSPSFFILCVYINTQMHLSKSRYSFCFIVGDETLPKDAGLRCAHRGTAVSLYNVQWRFASKKTVILFSNTVILQFFFTLISPHIQMYLQREMQREM